MTHADTDIQGSINSDKKTCYKTTKKSNIHKENKLPRRLMHIQYKLTEKEIKIGCN